MGYIDTGALVPFIINRNLTPSDFKNIEPIHYEYKNFIRFKDSMKDAEKKIIVDDKEVVLRGKYAFFRHTFYCTRSRWEYILYKFYGGWVSNIVMHKEPLTIGTRPFKFCIVDASLDFKYINDFLKKQKKVIYEGEGTILLYFNENVYNLKDVIENVAIQKVTR